MTLPNELPRVPLLVWGASGHAKVVADAAIRSGLYEVVGFLDDVSPERAGSRVLGELAVLGGAEQLERARAGGIAHVVVGIGDNAARQRVAARAKGAGFALATVIHPAAVVADSCTLGEGSFVAAGAVLNPDVSCGTLVIVNTGATVDHDCRLGDAVHVSPGAHIAGKVTIGDRAWIGVGAAVRDGMLIGADTVVGAGAAVVHDLPAGVLAYGVPARVRAPSSKEAPAR